MLGNDFDAAVGRLVLMYTRDVSESLQAIAARVRPGGVVAFAEGDFTPVLGYVRAGPAAVSQAMWEWGSRAFACAGIPISMAAELHRGFIDAGLGAPEMALQAPLGVGEGSPSFEWAAESLRSLLPILEQHGIVTAEILDVDNLAARCRDESVRTGVPFMLAPLVTAWARKPLLA